MQKFFQNLYNMFNVFHDIKSSLYRASRDFLVCTILVLRLPFAWLAVVLTHLAKGISICRKELTAINQNLTTY